ncbi:hypothetical protein L195_g037137 [Trifolium pratense]|uniref:Uncharacterized protein n=1 Tax=Trifolium pratense TaxID=57577 RepID=A0A2K3LRG3_TRIPR|nr:hypothetical protein L195_g037137 [Trifolium pratense]
MPRRKNTLATAERLLTINDRDMEANKRCPGKDARENLITNRQGAKSRTILPSGSIRF